MKKLLLSIGFILTMTIANAQILNYSVGDVVADFTVTTIDGESINLYDITATGQYVFIDFFFVDCGPCQLTAPHFNELHETYGCNEGDIFCMSMNTGQDDDAYVQTYEDNYGGDFAPCPIISGDGDAGNVDTDFNPAAYPTICLIGPDNTILNLDIWPVSSYMTFVDALVAEGFTPTEMECTVTGIDEYSNELNVVAYPNPANDFIILEVNDVVSSVKLVEIFNTSGQKVMTKNVESSSQGRIEINTSEFENGLYIATIYNENNQVSTVRFNVVK